MAPSPLPVASPCIQVCVVDGESGLCLGCHRTLAEIGAWSRLGEDERRAIVSALAGRRSRIGAGKLRLVGAPEGPAAPIHGMKTPSR